MSPGDDEKKGKKQKSSKGWEPYTFVWTGMIRGDH